MRASATSGVFTGLSALSMCTNEKLQTCAAKLALAVTAAITDPHRQSWQLEQLFKKLLIDAHRRSLNIWDPVDPFFFCRDVSMTAADVRSVHLLA